MLGARVESRYIIEARAAHSQKARSIFDRDYPIIQGVTLAFGLLVMLVNLATDLSYAALDPRVSYQ